MKKIPKTLFELLSQYIVEIPKIQRDYVQGRMDGNTEIVRQQLLQDMKDAVLGKKINKETGKLCEVSPLDLNFVYGKKRGEIFIPLDGQQRLTTLFLLYLYAFSDDSEKTNLFYRFTYETRISSREFLKCIIKNRASIFNSELSPATVIADEPWFLSNWKYDPTIQSVLTMMNEIKTIFSDVDNLGEKLEDNSPIFFHFRDIEELGMEDSLYIKLNARGKSLTPFENFKSQFVGKMEMLDIEEREKEDFKIKFDGKWTDVIWKDNPDKFDEVFLNFFEILLINNGYIKEESLWWSREEIYQNLDLTIYQKVRYLFDFLSDDKQEPMLKKYVFIPIRDKATSSYADRVLFHALTMYLYKSKGLSKNGDLQSWMRIINNLVVNSQINRIDLFTQAIDEINNNLSCHWNDLTQYFTQNIHVSVFNREQIEEERVKAKIIKNGKSFAKKIFEAEKNEYFRGQIRAALYLSKDNNGYSEAKFCNYWKKIEMLFSKYSNKDFGNEDYYNWLRRALLTYDDYRLTVAAYKTLCVTDPYENSRTPSLRALFSKHGEAVKKLMDNINCQKDIESQLKDIVATAQVPESDWRYCIINYPNNFVMMDKRHLRMRNSNGNWIMIPNKASNGYNYDLYLNTLRLKINKYDCEWAGYYGTDEERWLYINNRQYRIYFEKNHYRIESENNNQTVFVSNINEPITDTYNFLKSKQWI